MVNTQQLIRPGARPQHPVLNFILLAWGLSWLAWIGLAAFDVPLLGRTLIAMFGPLVAARILDHGSQREPSAHPIARSVMVRRSVTAVGLMGLLMAGGILLAVLGGVQRPSPAASANLLGLAAQWPLVLAIGLIFCISAYGEEAGWRGYLLAHLAHLGRARAALVTAPVWAVWHYPAILLFGFNYPHHRLLGAGVLLVMAVPLTLVQTWVRTWTGTVLASAATHAVFNIVGVVSLLVTAHVAMYLAAPVGLLGMVPFALFAVWIVATHQLDPVVEVVTEPAPRQRLRAMVAA